MIQLEFHPIGHKVNFPEQLSECSKAEYISMSRFMLLYQSGKITMEQFLSLSVFSLLNVQRSKKPLDKKTAEQVFDNVALLSDYVMNFFIQVEEEGKMRLEIKQEFLHNPIETFRFNGVTYKGPSDAFRSINFGQYIDGFGAYMDFMQFQEIESLSKLISIFYKPSNRTLHKILKPDFNQLDIGILYGFYLFFASFQKWLSTSSNIYLDGVEINLSIIFQPHKSDEKDTSEIPGIGAKALLHSIAASGIYGTVDEVRATPFWDILPRLYEIRKTALDERARYAKQNPPK